MVNCLILAGGESRRMGRRDKAQLLYQYKPMIEHVIDALPDSRGKLIISCNQHQEFYSSYSEHLVSDDLLESSLQNCGPLPGVLAALEFANDLPLLVLPCDTPAISQTTVELLLSHHQNQNQQLSCVAINDQLQPLHCVIDPELLESLKAFLLNGQRKAADWVFSTSPSALDCSDRADEFVNINNPSDLEHANTKNRAN